MADTTNKNRTLLYVGIGCGALALLALCAIFILPFLGAVVWGTTAREAPPPTDYTAQPPG